MIMNKELIARWQNKGPQKTDRLVNVIGDQAEIYLYDVIGSEMFGGISSKQFADELNNLKGVKNITVRINSPGGDLFEGLAMYNLLAGCKPKKTMMIDGLAASIASVIAMAGDEVVMAPEADMMIHSAWVVSQGNSSDLRKMAEQLDSADQKIQSIYDRKTGLGTEKLAALMTAETWMNASQAKEMGFCDVVTTPVVKNEVTTKIVAKISPIEVLRLRAGLVGKP